jgi:hypothetical protein
MLGSSSLWSAAGVLEERAEVLLKSRSNLSNHPAPLQDSNGFSITVPAGVKHNIINTSTDKHLKLYTLYSPPNHCDGVIHKTKPDAEADEEHFDGVTTE